MSDSHHRWCQQKKGPQVHSYHELRGSQVRQVRASRLDSCQSHSECKGSAGEQHHRWRPHHPDWRSQDNEAQHGETSLPLTSGQQHCNPTAPTWLPANLQLLYFYFADALSCEEDYCVCDKVFKLPQGQRNSCSR